MVSCAACGLSKDNKKTKESGISYHRFPLNPKRKKAWVDFMNKPNWEPKKTTVLCSRHFQKNCFTINTNISRLNDWSIPTIRIFRIKKVQSFYPEEIEKIDLRTCDENAEVNETLDSSTLIEMNASDNSNEFICESSRNHLENSSPVDFKVVVDNSSAFISENSHAGNSSPEDFKIVVDNSNESIFESSRKLAENSSLENFKIVGSNLPQKICLKRKLQYLNRQNSIKSKKIRILQQHNWRYRKRIACLKTVIELLKLKKFNS